MKIYLRTTDGETKCIDQIENGNRPFDDFFKTLTRASVRAKMLNDFNTSNDTDEDVRMVRIAFGNDTSNYGDKRCYIDLSKSIFSNPPFELCIFVEDCHTGDPEFPIRVWFINEELTELELLRFTIGPKPLIERIEKDYPEHVAFMKSLQRWDDIRSGALKK